MMDKTLEVMELLKSNNNVALIGKCRTGKTTLLKTLKSLLEAENSTAKIIYLDAQLCIGMDDFYAMICDELKLKSLRGYQLTRKMRKINLVLLIDECQRFSVIDPEHRLQGWLRALSQEGKCKLVLASQTSLESEAVYGSPLANVCIEVKL